MLPSQVASSHLTLPADAVSSIVQWLPNPNDVVNLSSVCKYMRTESMDHAIIHGLRMRVESLQLLTGERTDTTLKVALLQQLMHEYAHRPPACGTSSHHTVFVTRNGDVLVCGNDINGKGVLGQGEYITTVSNAPSLVASLRHARIVCATAAAAHTVVVSENGDAYSWGAGGCGQLGHGDSSDLSTPTRVTLPVPGEFVVSVSAALEYTVFLTKSGKVFVAGRSCCFATIASLWQTVNRPQLLPGLPFVTAIAAAPTALLALTAAGDVLWCCYGILNISSAVYSLRTNGIQRVLTHAATDVVVVVAVGGTEAHPHCLVATAAGCLYAWGSGSNGQLGLGGCTDYTQPQHVSTPVGVQVTAVAAGGYHSLVVGSGTVYSFGSGAGGVLGVGDLVCRDIPIAVVAIRDRVTSVAAGLSTSLAVTSAGLVYGWGCGEPIDRDDNAFEVNFVLGQPFESMQLDSNSSYLPRQYQNLSLLH
jgi:alpha-tubulin suppressor-like RCC1 family protein